MGNARKREAPHASSSKDKGRGITNVTVAKNTNPERFTPPAHAYGMDGQATSRDAQDDSRYETAEKFSVGKQFIAKESIDAQAFNRRRDKEEVGEPEYLQEIQRQERNIRRAQTVLQGKMNMRGRLTGKAVRKLAKSPWMGVGVATTAYFWQFICGIISIIALSAQSEVSNFFGSSTLGKAVKWATSFFVDIESLFPIGAVGWVFWGISTLIAISIFIIFFLYFYITGTRVLHSTMATIITIGCLTFSLIPILNLGPWLVLWILYVSTSSLFSSS